MSRNYTGCFTKIDSGYMGQLIEWPAVVTEGATLEECKLMLVDATREMILAHEELGLPIPHACEEIAKISVSV